MAKRIISVILALVMLAGALLVTVSAEESLYKDVKVKRWSYKDIMYVSEKGLMNGKSEGIFAPAETMTRAMVVTVFYRLAGSPAVEYAATFTDVKANKWFTDAVIWASNNGIVNGTGDAKYEPMANVTREQLATIIMRYAQFAYIKTEKTVDITGYADYKRIHDYAREAMAWANAEGLITGKTEDTLAPREGATREQFAAILHRFDTAEFDYELVYNTPVYGQNYTAPEYELVTDADIYVAVDGDDNNPGTLDKPIKTFEKARDMVRAMDKTGRSGIKVAFKAGDYGNLDNITFTAEDAGTAECPITYCAYGDGRVLFTNGVQIPGSSFEAITDEEAKMFPEEAAPNIYKVDLSGKIDEIDISNVLFGGIGPCDVARYPNRNSDGSDKYYKDFTTRVEEEGKTEQEYDSIMVSGPLPKEMSNFKTFEGMYITGYLRTGWFQDTFPVKSYDASSKIITFDFENYDFNGVYTLEEYTLAYEDRMDDMIYFQNIPQFLDTDGEYWFNEDAKVLYVYSPVGNYALPTGGKFMTVDESAEYLRFIGLEFNATTDSAVTAKADHTVFDGCTIGNVGGIFCLETGNALDLTVTNCEFFGFVCCGIANSGYDGNEQDLYYAVVPQGLTITNNYFHDFGLPQYFEYAVAINIDGTVGAYIAHNEFVRGAHGAINYSWCLDTVIEHNVFDTMMKNTQDYGAIYTYRASPCRGNEIRYNLFMNMRNYEAVHSIYFDGAYGGEVYGNLFYNAGDVFFNEGRDHSVHDNISITSGTNRTMIVNKDRLLLLGDVTVDGALLNEKYGYDTEPIMNLVPKEEDSNYGIWKEKWPVLYSYNYDYANYGDKDCFYTMYNEIKNNSCIATELLAGKHLDGALVIENNKSFTANDNPYFKNPANGDYTIVSGESDFKYVFDFEAVGRQ
ncbi:MAG: S-layer homology domain-containing protein [Clostridia bacterium]|nr:S-layer homology domain-containing protein [Clostridia bacterium]